MTARGSQQLPAWRPPPPPKPGVPSWLVPVLVLALLVLLLLLAYRLLPPAPSPGSRPPPATSRVAAAPQLDAPPPLQVVAGTSATLPLHVRRNGYRGPLTVSASGLPPRVTIADATVPPGADQVDLQVSARDAPPVSTQVTLTAAGDGQHAAASLPLTVLVLPPKCQPLEPRVVQDSVPRPYYRRIAEDLPGGTRVAFVLVPRTRDADPPTFYIMENKVSVALFRKYLQETGDRPPLYWNGQAGLDRPALGMSARAAYACAAWLGGQLPTALQWDKAAGFFDAPDREGPYRGKWSDTAPPAVAVRHPDDGPLPVGVSEADVSVFGCRDMSGNGYEWTGTPARGGRARFGPDPLPPGTRLALRGWSYRQPRPLRFDDLRAASTLPKQDPGDALGDLGFRVVLELL